MKVCNKCKTSKPLSDFSIDKTLSTGTRGICKVCDLEYQNVRYRSDPEYRERKLRLGREYYRNRKASNPMYRRIPGNLKVKKVKEVKVRKVRPEKIVSFKRPSAVCQIITEHHNLLKDDPNRLTTEFIQMLVGVECEV
jgi:hypothetical protein